MTSKGHRKLCESLLGRKLYKHEEMLLELYFDSKTHELFLDLTSEPQKLGFTERIDKSNWETHSPND